MCRLTVVVPVATVVSRKKVVVLMLRTWRAVDCKHRTAIAMVGLKAQAADAAGYRLETPSYLTGDGRFCLIADNSR
jgi:hypothetical protein